MSFNLSVDEFNNSLKQWALSYEMEVAQLTGTYQGEPTYAAQQDQLNRLSQSGYALLQAGVLPSQEQLDAMGMTQQEAYYWMQANGFMQIYGLEGTPFETTLRGAFGGRLGGIFGGGSGGRRSSSGSGGGGLPSGSSGGSSRKSSGGGGNYSSYSQNSSMSKAEISATQRALGVTVDGVWGPKTQAAFDKSGKSTNYLTVEGLVKEQSNRRDKESLIHTANANGLLKNNESEKLITKYVH